MGGAPLKRASESDEAREETNLSVHVFSASSAMVGVCLTVIGILRVITSLKPIQTLGDDLLAVDAVFFVLATLIAYAALKQATASKRKRLEQVADIIFLSALTVMALVCFLIVYAVTEK